MDLSLFSRLITWKQIFNPIPIQWLKLIEIQQRQLVCKTNWFVCKTFCTYFRQHNLSIPHLSMTLKSRRRLTQLCLSILVLSLFNHPRAEGLLKWKFLVSIIFRTWNIPFGTLFAFFLSVFIHALKNFPFSGWIKNIRKILEVLAE